MIGRKKKIGNKNWQLLTIAVIIAMTLAVIVLRFFYGIKPDKAVPNQQTERLSLDELFDQMLPEDDLFQVPQPSLAAEKLASQEMTITGRDGQELKVFVSKPTGSGPFAAVLLLHGNEASVRAASRISKILGERFSAELEVVAVSVDWRESELGTDDLGDVLAAIDWLRELVEVGENQPIMLLGTDYGSYLTLLAADAAPAEFAGIIAAYGYIDPAAHYNFLQQSDAAAADKFLTQTACDLATQPTSCLQQLSLVDAITVNMPILILHNSLDQIVSVEQSRQLRDMITPNLVTYIELNEQTADHDILAAATAAGFDAAWQAMVGWIAPLLNPTAATAADAAAEIEAADELQEEVK